MTGISIYLRTVANILIIDHDQIIKVGLPISTLLANREVILNNYMTSSKDEIIRRIL